MAVQQFSVLDAGTFAAAGNGDAISLSTATMAALFVNITGVTGSATPELDAWLEFSLDNGITWGEFPADLVLPTGGTALQAKRLAVDGAMAASKHVAVYKHVPVALVRFAFDPVGGTYTAGQGFTMSALMSVK